MGKKLIKEKKEIADSFSLLTDFDVHLFKSGKHYKLYEKLGAHAAAQDGKKGIYFAVWAPNAKAISVIGNFNQWNNNQHKLNPRWDESGIWEAFFPDIVIGEVYKYAIKKIRKKIVVKYDYILHYISLPPFTNGTYLRGEARPQARDLGDLSHSCMETAIYRRNDI